MILPYVYKLTHKNSGHFYIGYRCKNVSLGLSSVDDLGVFYFTSSKLINKKNIGEYHIEIIAEFYHSNDAYDFEQELIRDYWDNNLLINDHHHYNGAGRWKNPGHTTETRKKISDARKGYKASEKTRQEMSISRTGRKLSEQGKKNIALSKMGDKNPMFGKVPHNKLNLTEEEMVERKRMLNHLKYLRRMERKGPGPRVHKRK